MESFFYWASSKETIHYSIGKISGKKSRETIKFKCTFVKYSTQRQNLCCNPPFDRFGNAHPFVSHIDRQCVLGE